jgi:hypothetical protein
MLINRNRYLWVVLFCTLIAACSDLDKAGISNLLDARDRAITHRSISEYSALIASDFNDNGRSKVDIVAQMVSLFDKFEKAEMHSYDREIRRLSDTSAQCEQTYMLKVFADGQWRQIVQREQLTLANSPHGWKISSGL